MIDQTDAFGTRAKQYCADLAFAQIVTVRVMDSDRYGRAVGEVILPDARSLNHLMVGAGLSWWYEKYAPHDTELQQLEAEAREARRGLWADPDPIPPWEFRRDPRTHRGTRF